jgi:ribosome-associated protein
MQSEALLEIAQTSLEELKARDIRVLDVRNLTTVTDYLLIVSGTSNRHVKSLGNQLIASAKQAGQPPIGVEGQEVGEWVLIDLADIVVHIMQPRVREFYKLEDLWSVGVNGAAGSSGS